MAATSDLSIALVLKDLGVGGAERAVIRLANFAARCGVPTHLISLTGSGPLVAEVDPAVAIHDLAVDRIRRAGGSLRSLLTRVAPTTVMSTLPQVNALVSATVPTLRPAPKLVIREANDPRFEAPYSKKTAPFIRLLLRRAYRRADLVIAVSRGVREGVMEQYGVQPGKVVALKNASIDDASLARADVPLADHWFLAHRKRLVCVARLSPQKDHHTLLKAFAELPSGTGTGLALLGDGPLEAEIHAEIARLGLHDRVKLVAGETNPFRWLKHADALVLSSRWEGSPNVLVEALAMGVPVVSTDCPSGPREILADGRFGELVPVGDAAALSAAIGRTLAARVDAEQLVERGMEYHIDQVGPAWLAALR